MTNMQLAEVLYKYEWNREEQVERNENVQIRIPSDTKQSAKK